MIDRRTMDNDDVKGLIPYLLEKIKNSMAIEDNNEDKAQFELVENSPEEMENNNNQYENNLESHGNTTLVDSNFSESVVEDEYTTDDEEDLDHNEFVCRMRSRRERDLHMEQRSKEDEEEGFSLLGMMESSITLGDY